MKWLPNNPPLDYVEKTLFYGSLLIGALLILAALVGAI